MEWNRENKYKKINEYSGKYIENLIQKVQSDKFYPTFHIAPFYGLINDPNGLCFKDGYHHIFYQWSPSGPIHSLKYWYHLRTKDYCDFEDCGVAIEPIEPYESHGVYSGSSFIEDDVHYIFYTGNSRDDYWNRISTQCLALVKDEKIEKHGIVIENEHFTEHFRDPKVIKLSNDEYRLVLGVQTKELRGQIAMYRSKDLFNFEYEGILNTRYENFGYMWECPDVFDLNGKTVVLFCPQGVKSNENNALQNTSNVVCLVGDCIDERLELVNHLEYQQLDYGFDFYAPQTYTDDKGRRVMIAWVGVGDKDNYDLDAGWAHMLTVPRELKIANGILYQYPLFELKKLRECEITINSAILKLERTSFELNFNIEENFLLKLSNSRGESMIFTANNKNYVLDKSNTSIIVDEPNGNVRYCERVERKDFITIYFDNSVIEIFMNNNRNTMTSRILIDDLDTLELNGVARAKFYYLGMINCMRK